MDPPNQLRTAKNIVMSMGTAAAQDNLEFLQQETNMRIVRAPVLPGAQKLELINGLIKSGDKLIFQTQIRPDDTFIQEEYVGALIKSIRIRQLTLPPPYFTINNYIPVNILEISCRVNIRWVFTFISALPALTFVRFGAAVFEELVELHRDEFRWPLETGNKSKVQELHIRVDPTQWKKNSAAATQTITIVNTIFHYADMCLKKLEHAEFLVPSGAKLDYFLSRCHGIEKNGKERKENLEDGIVFYTTNRLYNNANAKINTEVSQASGASATTMQQKKENFYSNWNRQDLGQNQSLVPAAQMQELDVHMDRESFKSLSPDLAPGPSSSWSPAHSSSTASGDFSPTLRQESVKRKAVDESDYDDPLPVPPPSKSQFQSFQGDDDIKISEEYPAQFSRPAPQIPVSEQFPSFANPIKICNIPGLFEGLPQHQIRDDQSSISSFDSNESDDFVNLVPTTRIEERSSVSNNQLQPPRPVPAPRSQTHEIEPEVINVEDEQGCEYNDTEFRSLYTRRAR